MKYIFRLLYIHTYNTPIIPIWELTFYYKSYLKLYKLNENALNIFFCMTQLLKYHWCKTKSQYFGFKQFYYHKLIDVYHNKPPNSMYIFNTYNNYFGCVNISFSFYYHAASSLSQNFKRKSLHNYVALQITVIQNCIVNWLSTYDMIANYT